MHARSVVFALGSALAAAGCSQHVYAPPLQALGLGPVATLKPGQQAAAIEVSRSAQIFDPEIGAGALRYRRGVGSDAEVSLEGTAFAVEDTGPSTAPRTFYAGRAGVQATPGDAPISFFAGVGGGYAAAAGTFTGLDGGVAVGFENCVLVPLARASTFVSQPLDARPVDVHDGSPPEHVVSVPQRTTGVALRAGLRLSLDHAACRRGEPGTWLEAGVGMTELVDATSTATLGTIGLGVSFPL